MLNRTKLSLLLTLALGVAGAGRASADHERARDGNWRSLARVGTHVHDEEDFVNVPSGTRLDAVQLRAEQSPVAVDGVRVHYADGHDERVAVHQRIQPGQTLTIDIPRSSVAVKTLVLDYGNEGPYWRARETAHLQVLGLVDDGLGDRARDRMNDKRDRLRHRPDYDRGAQVRPDGTDRMRTGPAYGPGVKRLRTDEVQRTRTDAQRPRTDDGRDRDERTPTRTRDGQPTTWVWPPYRATNR